MKIGCLTSLKKLLSNGHQHGHLVDPVIGGLTYNGYFLKVPEIIGTGADDAFLKTCEN